MPSPIKQRNPALFAYRASPDHVTNHLREWATDLSNAPGLQHFNSPDIQHVPEPFLVDINDPEVQLDLNSYYGLPFFDKDTCYMTTEQGVKFIKGSIKNSSPQAPASMGKWCVSNFECLLVNPMHRLDATGNEQYKVLAFDLSSSAIAHKIQDVAYSRAKVMHKMLKLDEKTIKGGTVITMYERRIQYCAK